MSTLAKLMVELGMDSKGFDSGLGKSMGGLVKFGIGVATVGIAAGAGLLKIGSDWDAATDTIITKTGASGKALTDLEKTTKDVFKSIPTDMQTAADAVSDLSVRTGATGKDLDLLASSEIELARITKTDLTNNIEASTKIFNSFGVEVKDQTSTLDSFFRISQKTGIGVDVLMQQVEQFNPQLKAMGLNATQGANLIAKIDQAGGHASVIFRGMTKATNELNKAGIPLKKGMTDYYNSIKNAGSAADASAIAVELFGSKAGPELAQMIRDGTLSVDDLTGAVDENGATILETAGATNDFSENFRIFKNNLEAALIPLGTLVFQGLNLLIPLLTAGVDAISRFASALGDAFATSQEVSTIVQRFPGFLQPVVAVFLQVADAIGDVVRAYERGGFKGMLDAIPGAIGQVLAALGNLASEVAGAVVDLADWTLHVGIPKVGGWLVDIGYDIWGWIKGKLGIGPAITGDGTGGPGTDKNVSLTDWVFDVAVPTITGWISDFISGAKSAGSWLLDELQTGWNKIADLKDWTLSVAVPGISEMAGGLVKWVQDWLDTHAEIKGTLSKWTLYLNDPSKVNMPNLDSAVSAEANKRSTTAILIDWYLTLKGEPKTQGNQEDVKRSVNSWLETNIKDAFTIQNITVNTPVVGQIVGFPEAMNDALNTLEPIRLAISKANIDFSGLKDPSYTGLGDFGFTLGERLAQLVGDADVGKSVSDSVRTSIEAVTDWGTQLYDSGASVITGLNDGMASAWHLITESITGAIAWVLTQFVTAQAWLNGPGQMVITGLNDGLAAAWHLVVTSIQGAISWVITQFGTARTWLKAAGSDVITGLNDGLASAWHFVTSSISGAISYIISAFSGSSGWLWDAGFNLVWGMAQGIYGGAGQVLSAVSYIVGLIPDAVKKLLGMLSPSKVMRELFVNVPLGAALGIRDGEGVMQSAAGRMAAIASGSIGSPSLSIGALGSSGGARSLSRIGDSGVGQTNNISVVVHALPGMNEQQLADYTGAAIARSLSLQGAA